jgi:hypothetical protein
MPVWQVSGLGVDHTQDPQVSIKDLITSNWSLTGDLAVEKIEFNTGWYNKQQDYQLHFRHDKPPIKKARTIGQNCLYKYDDFVNIHVFANKQTDNFEPVELGQMYREIDRIISINIIALRNTQGFTKIFLITPCHTLPREQSQASIWHGYGEVGILYHKINA